MYILISEYEYGYNGQMQREASINLENSNQIMGAIRANTDLIQENFNIDDEDLITHRLFKQIELEFSHGLIIKE